MIDFSCLSIQFSEECTHQKYFFAITRGSSYGRLWSFGIIYGHPWVLDIAITHAGS